jgi:hypothetical protein
MRTTNYNIQTAKSETTFNGFNVIFPFDITGKLAKMDVRKAKGTIVYPYTLGAGLTIVGDDTLKFDKQVIHIPAGTYQYDILLYEENGDYNRYLSGEWIIEETITTI